MSTDRVAFAIMITRRINSVQPRPSDNAEPDRQCHYCGLTGIEYLLECADCEMSFCNMKGKLQRSHIVAHLVAANHNSVVKREEPFSCAICDETNVFRLGKVNDDQGRFVDIFCRPPCHTDRVTMAKAYLQHAPRDIFGLVIDDDPLKLLSYTFLDWSPLITNDMFTSGYTLTPHSAEQNEAVATVDPLDVPFLEHRCAEPCRQAFISQHNPREPLPPAFTCHVDYCRRFTRALKAEEFYENDQLVLRQRIRDSSDVEGKAELDLKRWKTQQQYQRFYTMLAIVEDSWITKLPERFARLFGSVGVPDSDLPLIPLRREIDGAEQIGYISNISNEHQIQAVRLAIDNPLVLIQGPPGTGKTTTAKLLVWLLSYYAHERVLYCTPSNVAADHAALELEKQGLVVVRVYAPTRENANSRAYHLSSKHFEREDRRTEKAYIQFAGVVCTTLAYSTCKRLKSTEFTTIIVDEAAQAIEPATLLPLTRGGCRRLILIGDHLQLRPVVLSPIAAQMGLGRSLFERLIDMPDIPSICLRVQYRMHPALADIPSGLFYGGQLTHGDQLRPVLSSFPWPVIDVPLMFWHVEGVENRSPTGRSFLNEAEAIAVTQVVLHLLMHDKIPARRIGVITMYAGQRDYIKDYWSGIERRLDEDEIEDLEVSTVDGFQGREKDYIIVSCVRSLRNAPLRFLGNNHRLNVALTRARFGLIIVGNSIILAGLTKWADLIRQVRERELMVQ